MRRPSRERRAVGSSPVTTASSSRTSATERPSGPGVSRVEEIGTHPAFDEHPSVGRNPTHPHRAAGIRHEPPVSPPRPTGMRPAATAAAVPPLEPPVWWSSR